MKAKIVVMLLAVGFLFACNKRVIRSIEDDMTDGLWRVSYFYENGFNKTIDYENYTFNFNDNGTVNAYFSDLLVTGTWNISSKNRHIKFYLSFPEPLDDLSDDWEVLSNSSGRIELKDVSGDGSVDYLIFTKL